MVLLIIAESENNQFHFPARLIVKKYSANSVGVYAISFDEITPILIQSPLYDS